MSGRTHDYEKLKAGDCAPGHYEISRDVAKYFPPNIIQTWSFPPQKDFESDPIVDFGLVSLI